METKIIGHTALIKMVDRPEDMHLAILEVHGNFLLCKTFKEIGTQIGIQHVVEAVSKDIFLNVSHITKLIVLNKIHS